ncbi:MAG TPA: hypothetical protein VMT38_05650 [Terracidiphilus sp.]|nr:hypothetical protein [Terracidiphilus sp.]
MKALFRLVVCWFAFVVALMLAGVIAAALHISMGRLPGGASPQALFIMQLIGGVVLVVGLWPLARSLRGPAVLRAAAFVAFLLLAFGVNGVIEARKFTNFLDAGIAGALLFDTSVAIVLGVSMGLLFGNDGKVEGFPHRAWPLWAWRIVAGWLGWPITYFVFGMCIAPIVTPYYQAGTLGLRIPTMSTVVATQLIRSAIFLVASLPFVALWKGTRRNLWLTLGLAHAFTIGLYGIVSATFLPMVLRVSHSIEMTCDGFAYAGLLVLLFAAPATANARTEMAGSVPLQPQPLH